MYFFSSRRRHTIWPRDWSSDVCSSDLSPLAKAGARLLYDYLVESEVNVYEYWERQLHAKIAAFDDDWATIGSSNLDPLSLCLNLEANVFVRSAEFNQEVQERSEERRVGKEGRKGR